MQAGGKHAWLWWLSGQLFVGLRLVQGIFAGIRGAEQGGLVMLWAGAACAEVCCAMCARCACDAAPQVGRC